VGEHKENRKNENVNATQQKRTTKNNMKNSERQREEKVRSCLFLVPGYVDEGREEEEGRGDEWVGREKNSKCFFFVGWLVSFI